MIYRRKTKKISNIVKTPLKNKINMRGRLKGLFFFSFFFFSLVAGLFFLICPAIPLVLISPKKYRRWTDIVFGMWEPFPVALMEIFFGTRIILSGDKINPFEGSLCIMNHRTRVDWNFLWMCLFHCCEINAHAIKYVLKSSIRHFPCAGWVMQTCSFIFVHRNWEKDKPLLDKMLDYLNESDPLYQVLIFPEGTDLTESNIQKSHKYAAEHNLERYYKVLHPRTKGFAFLANKMKKSGHLQAIYDLTIAYPKTLPQNESDLLRGNFPEEVHFHVKRHSSSNIPFQELELRNWLTDIWREKERSLQRFYDRGYFCKTSTDEDDLKIDYGKVGKKNGAIFYKNQEGTDSYEVKNFNVKGLVSSSLSSIEEQNTEASTSKYSLEVSNFYSHMSYNTFRSKNYKTSHLLFVVFFFWLIMIFFLVYAIFFNYYLRIWIFVHSLLFSGLSLVSTGFHYIAASIYFYRYDRKRCIVKKNK